MINLLCVGLGGALGAILRYLLSVWMALSVEGNFPWATLLINISGCFAIGILAPLLSSESGVPAEYRLLLVVGLLGGFTTFSAYGWESISLYQRGELASCVSYVLLSNLAGLLAVVLGIRLSGT